MTVYVRRPSGLVAEFDPPEVTPDASADRGWHLDGLLMLPNQPEYLPTYPATGYRDRILDWQWREWLRWRL